MPTGFAIEVPPGFEMQVRPRSGLAAKHGITLPNSPATIDSDYRGEVRVIVQNLGPRAVRHRARHAHRADRARGASRAWSGWSPSELTATSREGGGFGHTGVK